MSIYWIKEKIKQVPEDNLHSFLVVIIMISVAIASFSIGRLSVKTGEGGMVEVVYPEEIVQRAQASLNETQIVVASTRGSKYHYPWCPGAISMSEKNKIEFESIEAARNAGYTPAANCDGLE